MAPRCGSTADVGVPNPDPRVSRPVVVPRVDMLPVEGGKPCSRCGRVKPVGAFPAGTRCRTCRRHIDAERRAAGLVKARTTEQATAAQRRWLATPAGRATQDAWRQSVRGRLSAHLATTRYRLARAKTPEQAERLRGLIEQVTAELARVRAAQDG